jgi:DNA replication protein DnaC
MIQTEQKNIDQTEFFYSDTKIVPVLDLVLTRIRLLAKRRIAWLRKLWREQNNGGENKLNLHTEVDSYLNDYDTPELEATWLAGDESVQQWNQELAETEQILEEDKKTRFTLLHQIFGLNKEESDLFQACLGLAIDPGLSRVYAYLQDHSGRGYVTEELVARLFGYGRCLLLSSESPLRIWRLIFEKEVGRGEPGLIECDNTIRNWLLGMNDLSEQLVGFTNLQVSREPLLNWPVEEAVGFIKNMVNSRTQQRVRLHILGAPGSGRRTLAACICERLSLPLLVIDTDQIGVQDWQYIFMHAQRHAYLERCALAWCGENLPNLRWPQVVPGFNVQFVIGEDRKVPPVPGVVDYAVEVPPLCIEERLALWKRLVPVSATWKHEALDALARRHQVNIGQIVLIAKKGVSSPEEAGKMLRESARHRLSNLAQLLECPFTWDDLVVGDWLRLNLDDFLFEAKERSVLWERSEVRRLFPQGRGLLALFTGSPGTGKTMAAQVIAASLGLDLFRIDLSSVVSKYVGETSKNLDRILSRAARMNAILLFDEADALFGKRTEIKDAHDRFANTDTNYLLQAIENYPGVAILASNKKGNIDSGFIRRLRYVLEFPKPDKDQRLKIWQRIVGELAGEECLQALTSEIDRLAESMELTGAQIKLSVLSALFTARREKATIAMSHLLHGLERELMKEGRGISRQVKDILLENVE